MIERGDNEFAMRMRGSCDDYRVNSGVGEKFIGITETSGDIEFRGHFLEAHEIGISDGDEFYSGNAAGKKFGVETAETAKSNQTHIQVS